MDYEDSPSPASEGEYAAGMASLEEEEGRPGESEESFSGDNSEGSHSGVSWSS